MTFKQLINRRIFLVPLSVWLIIIAAKCATLGVMAVGRAYFPKADLPGSWMVEDGHPFIDHLANFDGAWFIRVGAIGYRSLHNGDYDLATEKARLRVMDERGYEEGKHDFGYRHFPPLPFMIRMGQKIFRDWTLSGLLISNIFSIIYLLFLYRIAEQEFSGKAATWAVAFAVLAPNAHYLTAIYSEPLMLAGMVGAIDYARRGKWAVAMLFGMLASATRFEGTLLVVALFFILVAQQSDWRATLRDKRLLYIIGAPLGLLLPIIVAWMVAGSPLAPYATSHKALGVGVLWPWQAFRMDFAHPSFLTLGVDVPVLLIALCLTVLSARRLSLPLGALVVTMMLGRLSHPHIALLRFFIMFFPFYIYLGDLASRRPRLGIALLVISSLLLAAFSILFVNGYWVA